MPGGVTLSVNLAQRLDGRISVFVADFTVVVAVTVVETCAAHGALPCAYSRKASSCLDQIAILHRNRASKPERSSKTVESKRCGSEGHLMREIDAALGIASIGRTSRYKTFQNSKIMMA
jgi:hypothetical protein